MTGAARLRKWRGDRSRSEVARILEVHEMTVFHWEHGRQPSMQHMAKLRDLAGVPVEAWFPKRGSKRAA